MAFGKFLIGSYRPCGDGIKELQEGTRVRDEFRAVEGEKEGSGSWVVRNPMGTTSEKERTKGYNKSHYLPPEAG